MSALQKLFTPSGTKFYVLFEEAVANLIEMSKVYLKAAQDKNNNNRKSAVEEIEKLEEANDKLTHKLFIELGRNFITPFDREDIHYLASALDDIADDIWSSIKQLHRYDIKDNTGTTVLVAEQMVKFCEYLEDAIKGLRNKASLILLTSDCRKMRKLMSNCDHAVDVAIADLFANTPESNYTLIQTMDHYELIRGTIEKSGEAINVIEGVIIKYG